MMSRKGTGSLIARELGSFINLMLLMSVLGKCTWIDRDTFLLWRVDKLCELSS